MIATQPQKSTWVIVGTYNRASYFGRLTRVEEGRVYLAEAMRLPWTFDFEAMLDMALDGVPNQRVLTLPKRKGSIALFRPEEMIECTDKAAADWASMRWLDGPIYQPAVRVCDTLAINYQDTSGT